MCLSVLLQLNPDGPALRFPCLPVTAKYGFNAAERVHSIWMNFRASLKKLMEIVHLNGNGSDLSQEELERFIASFPIEPVANKR